VVPSIRTNVRICLKAMTRRGRAVELVRRRAGETVRWRVRVTNVGVAPASDVRVCILLPPSLILLRYPVRPEYRNGRPCLTIPLLSGQRQGFLTTRIAATARGRVRNVAELTTPAGDRRLNGANVIVLPSAAAGGGVTG
jgi:uncharacterized repeat protein (TIGR01451 family)